MLATVQSSALRGVDGLAVEVEVDLFGGSPGLAVVGLPEGAVKEGMFRVGAAVRNCGYKYPGGRRIVINLAPADLRKEGSAFDLPIAIGILAASGQLPREELAGYAILGELSLDGARQGRARRAADRRRRRAGAACAASCCPPPTRARRRWSQDLEVLPVRTLGEAVEFLRGELPIAPTRVDLQAVFNRDGRHDVDFADVRGQDARQARARGRRRRRPQRPHGRPAGRRERPCWPSAWPPSCRR